MGAKRVGQRIHVYWTDETAWFSGVVQQFSPSQGYYVVYDDGDERWEGLHESYRFDGQQSDSGDEDSDADSQEQEQKEKEHCQGSARMGGNDKTVVTRGATPRAMEPPGSDNDDRSETDDEEGAGGDAAGVGAEGMGENDDEDGGEAEELDREPAGGYPKPVVLRRDDDNDEDTNSEEEERDPGPGGDDDDTRSVALSEAPITYELPSRTVRPKTTMGVDVRRALPYRGVLRGVVVGATNLPRVSKTEEPSAFTRVAFVEAGSGGDATDGRRQSHTLMLRCKQTLAATLAVVGTSHPLWNDLGGEEDEDAYASSWGGSSSQLDGLFQLQVIPPMLAATGTHDVQPAWQQLKGDLLFSVYHQDQGASKRADFLGQASISLHELMRELLHGHGGSTPCIQMIQRVPLESRQGKPMGGGAELAIKFQFQPEYPPVDRRPTTAATKARPANDLRQPETTRASRPAATSSIASLSKSHPKSASSTRGAQVPKAGRSHQSSSEINRRKFEKKLEEENKAMAKRMAEQHREAGAITARRQQLNHQPPLVKSEPKPGLVAVKTAPPRSHKASSAINRTKFVDYVKQENKSMGKRLIERAGRVGHARRAPAKEAKGTKDGQLDWDEDKAQDKAHGADKRRVWRQEKDYLLEKAQAKYHQQHEVVEQVMALQTQVADWKAKLFTIKSHLQRLDAMNTKDTHVRDCLRRATEKTRPATTPMASSSSSSTARLEQLLGSDDDDDEKEDEGGKDPAVKQHKQKLRELLQEAASFENEQRRLEDQSQELSKQEAQLEAEILELHRKWQFIEAKRAFHAKMAANRATPAGAAYAGREMRSKKQAMELSTEEEEQYAIFQAHEELTQLQITATVLRDRVAKAESGSTRPKASSSPSSAACEQLRDKITKRKAKHEALETQQSEWRRAYEQLVVQGEYNKLRAHAQELQHLLFLCQSEAKHVAAAERIAKHSKDKKAIDLQKQRFQEQTETEILLKSSKASKPY